MRARFPVRDLRQLVVRREGTTVIEFAIIAPVLMLMLVGLLDTGYMAYVKVALEGAVQKAARDAALQTNASVAAAAALDARVAAQVQALGSNISSPTFARRYFRNYNAAAAHEHEPFNDKNGNGQCDNQEPYTDNNWNNVFDADGGDAGGGGAEDRAVYIVTVRYNRLLPLDNVIAVPREVKLVATTVLANQPYATQSQYPANPVGRKCP